MYNLLKVFCICHRLILLVDKKKVVLERLQQKSSEKFF